MEGDQWEIKCKETEQTFHVLLTFLSFPLLEGYEDICFIRPMMGWMRQDASDSLNCRLLYI